MSTVADGTFTPAPAALVKQAAEQNERDWSTTIEIVREAVKSFGPSGAPDDATLQSRCEAIWQWAKAETWVRVP